MEEQALKLDQLKIEMNNLIRLIDQRDKDLEEEKDIEDIMDNKLYDRVMKFSKDFCEFSDTFEKTLLSH